MWVELIEAVCLVLVLEGILPFLYPNRWRQAVAALATISDRQLRWVGLVSMVLGVSVLFLIK